jgi:hypothetical protein
MKTAVARNGRPAAIGGDAPTNGAKEEIEYGVPYTATFTLKGTADLLFHRWNCEAVAEKAGAAKGSKAKKTDNVESYVYRDEDNNICLPGEYVRGAIVNAAKFRQDPRSPRKSAMDLFKAGIAVLTPLASLGVDKWDYDHACRVTINRAGITRVRPAIRTGWKAEIQLLVLLPQYIQPELFQEVLTDAGRLIGVGDFRPTYGRFQVASFEAA